MLLESILITLAIVSVIVIIGLCNLVIRRNKTINDMKKQVTGLANTVRTFENICTQADKLLETQKKETGGKAV